MLIYGVPRQSLPPLSMLRAFAAAGRLLSFRDAARELGVTPSAISHQVRGLEEWIGSALFERGIRQIHLTPIGAQLASDLDAAFSAMANSVSRAVGGSYKTRLRISALPLFTNVWLVPRLARFQELQPGISITVETSNRLVDFQHEEIDVAIRNIREPTQGLAAHKLLDLRAVPICTSELARELRHPGDLAQATLVEIGAGTMGWMDWLKAAGTPDLKPRAILTFDTVTSALEACAHGRGVMLGLSPLIWDAPATRELVAPFGPPHTSAGSYYVVTRRSDRHGPAIRSFVNWLVTEMRADARRLKGLERRHTTQP
jgi:LysR family glycine cleavage system transcriptional activator